MAYPLRRRGSATAPSNSPDGRLGTAVVGANWKRNIAFGPRKRRLTMIPWIAAAFVIAASVGVDITPALAGPCSSKIAQFETAVRQSASNPNAGPSLPQSVGSQLGRQPTPGSIKQADVRAQSVFEAALAHAKRLDAQGNRAGCTKALARAQGMYNLQ